MITSRLAKHAAILLMGLLPWAAMAIEAPRDLRLLGHSTFANPSVVLDEADWRWLRERRTLSMGVSALISPL